MAVHAELIHAELLLERALLMFLQDEGLLTFVHAAFKVREAYTCFRCVPARTSTAFLCARALATPLALSYSLPQFEFNDPLHIEEPLIE